MVCEGSDKFIVGGQSERGDVIGIIMENLRFGKLGPSGRIE